jgi:hypothetical protein
VDRTRGGRVPDAGRGRGNDRRGARVSYERVLQPGDVERAPRGVDECGVCEEACARNLKSSPCTFFRVSRRSTGQMDISEECIRYNTYIVCTLPSLVQFDARMRE